ncbi:MAG: PorT family protein, partial [Bacteroidetes bacterium]
MRKFPFLLLLLCSLVWNASAQNRLGLRAGYNRADIKFIIPGFLLNHPITQFEHLDAYHAGFYYRWAPRYGLVGVRAELLYSVKGMHQGDFHTENPPPARLHYIALPVMVELKVNPAFWFNAGAEFALLANPSKNALHHHILDLGISFGLSYRLQPRLWLDARTVIGLMNLTGEQDGDLEGRPLGGMKSYNRLLQIGLLYDLMVQPLPPEGAYADEGPAQAKPEKKT